MRRRALWFGALTMLSAALCEPAGAQQPAPATAENRPRIGLVLGGGGARGMAHIGVLRVLEEHRIPIDCIAGTSIGALVGAGYASGMNAAEIEKLILGINWTETFASGGVREMQPVHLKTWRATYSNRLEFGLNRKGLLAPGGLVASQRIDSLLRTIVSRSRYRDSFDDLAIPYRAVATDISSGEMRVLSGGDLSVAMRASMAVPGAFAPVQLDDRVLVDGGLVRNLPVDIAREMCADVVIASSFVSPEPNAQELQSALAVVGQMLDIIIKNNERVQLQTLRESDVAILISLPEVGSADFHQAPAAIPVGDAAARAVAAQLARYSVSPEAYARWRNEIASAAAAPPKTFTVSEVRIDGLALSNADVVRLELETEAGAQVDEAQIVADAQRIFARGDYEKVDYRLQTTDAGTLVQFSPLEKPWGPDYLRFDLGLMSSSGGDTGYVLRLDHTRTWMNPLGGRWNNAVQIGRTALIETSLFQPLDTHQQWFVEPMIRVSREHQDIYNDGDRVARYDLSIAGGGFDVGAVLGKWGEWRVGVVRNSRDFEVETGDPLLAQAEDVDVGAFTSTFTVDTSDSRFAPTRGTYAHLDLQATSSALGSEDEYERAEFFIQHAQRFRDDLVYFEAGGGTDFNGDAPEYDLFTLGGPGGLAGFEYQELRGHEYAFGRIAYLRKVTDLQTLLGQALYAGMSVEAGNMFDRIDGVEESGVILGSSIFVGGRTLLGPLILLFGYSEGGHKAAYLQLGRPIKER